MQISPKSDRTNSSSSVRAGMLLSQRFPDLPCGPQAGDEHGSFGENTCLLALEFPGEQKPGERQSPLPSTLSPAITTFELLGAESHSAHFQAEYPPVQFALDQQLAFARLELG